jgi:sucrose-6-phosphate hydrolase SacC (GH32 family)
MSSFNIEESQWFKKASSDLVGKKITGIRYLTEDEQENMGWYSKSVVIELDDSTVMYPSQDDEGNDAGAIFYQTPKNPNGVLPVV